MNTTESQEGLGFFAKLNASVTLNSSLLCIGLDPNPKQIPERYVHSDNNVFESILTWNQAVIEETDDLVCAYKPNIAFYEALGSAGIDLLVKTLALIPSHVPVILDAKRGDIGSTAEAYARACFEYLNVDAVTLSPYLGRDSIEPFMQYGDKGLFILCHTSNPGSADFQELEISDWRALDRQPNLPLYAHVALSASGWSPNIGLVVAGTYPEAIQQVRERVPGAWFLVPGIGTQGGSLEATAAAGLRSDRSGILVNVSRGVIQSSNHRSAALQVCDALNRAREKQVVGFPSIPLDHPSSPELPPILDSLIIELVSLGAIEFGDFTLASGIKSPIYIDLRLLVSKPKLLWDVADAYAVVLRNLTYDLIAGVPYAALPIGTAVAMAVNQPMIYPRKEKKGYGLGKNIEGIWQAGDRVVILEDLITSGGSTIRTVERLRGVGLIVEDAIVLLDREQGGPENLAEAGVKAHSVFTLSTVLNVLTKRGQLDHQRADEVLTYIRSQTSQ